MTHAFVTGAAGFIGSSLVDRLLSEGHRVTGFDSFTEYYPRSVKLGNLVRARNMDDFELIEGDLLVEDLAALLDDTDFDVVVHLAAEPGVRTSWGDSFARYLERNVLATQRLLEALKPEEGQRFVFASSSSVYGSAGHGPLAEDAPCRPASPYGLTKLAAEELVHTYVRQSGLQATLLRYFTVYGPRQRPEMALSRFIAAMREDLPVKVFGDGEQEREFTHVSDIVAATVAALDAPAGTYNVGGGARCTVNELIEMVREELGSSSEVEPLPVVPGDVRSTWADSTRSKEILGYEPKVGLREGVASQVEWSLSSRRVS